MIRFLVFIFLSISFLGFSQNRMTPELLWKLKRVGAPLISPDGSKLAFTISSYDANSNSKETEVYWMEVKSQKLHQLTANNSNEFNLVWKPDGSALLYLAREKGVTQIFDHSLDQETGQVISKFKDNIGGFKVSGNFDQLLFIKEVNIRPNPVSSTHPDLPKAEARIIDELMYRHWDHYEDEKRSHIFLSQITNGKIESSPIDIMKGEDFDSPMMPFGGMEQINFSPDGNKIVYTCKKKTGADYAISTNSEIYRYDIASKKTEVLSKSKGYDVNPVYSEIGTKIAWLSMEEDGFESDKNDILVYDVTNKEIKNITTKHDLTVADFVWGKDDNTIYFKSVIEATYQLFELDLRNGKTRQITSGEHNYTSLGFADGVLVGGKQSMNHPTDIYKVDIKTGKETQLTNVNEEIYEKLEIGNIEKRWVTTSDGKKELVWLIYPPNFDKTKKYPTILYCQGGPQSAVSQFFSYRWNFQLMAANDYIIIAPNRRGLPGFGQEWNDDISGDWGGQPMRDYLAAVDELKTEPFIDENRMGAIGASYGGYSVYYLAGIHENRFKCFISHCGLFNLESWFGTTEELFFANKDIGGAYFNEKVPESYAKFSPHKLVKNWNTPMLIFHGEKDYRVPVNQGMEAFQALQLKGIDSKLILFPNENHWVLNPQNGILWHREFFKWLEGYLKN